MLGVGVGRRIPHFEGGDRWLRQIFPCRIHGTNGMLTYIFMVEFLMGSMWVNIKSSHGSSESMILKTCPDLVGTLLKKEEILCRIFGVPQHPI